MRSFLVGLLILRHRPYCMISSMQVARRPAFDRTGKRIGFGIAQRNYRPEAESNNPQTRTSYDPPPLHPKFKPPSFHMVYLWITAHAGSLRGAPSLAEH